MKFKRLYKLLLVLFLSSCAPKTSSVLEKYKGVDIVTSRLGKSQYLLHHPSIMFLEEVRGKEGQLGYGLWLKDSTSRFTGMSGFVEIEHGNGTSSAENDEPAIEFVNTMMLNKSVVWPVVQTETGYFTSYVKVEGLYFSASAPRRAALDSVIAILSTLTKD